MAKDFEFGHISDLTIENKVYDYVFIDEEEKRIPILSYCMYPEKQVIELRGKVKVVLPEKTAKTSSTKKKT